MEPATKTPRIPLRRNEGYPGVFRIPQNTDMSLSEQMRLQNWAKDMVDCQNSGLTQQQWCDLHGIRIKTFEYRCRRVRAAAEEYMEEQQIAALPQQTESFAAIPADAMKNAQDQSLGMPTMVIRFENATVEFSNGVLPAHLKMVLEVLTHVE